MRRHDLIGAKKTKGTIYMDEAQFHKRETADGGIISNRPLTGKVKSIKGNTVSWNQVNVPPTSDTVVNGITTSFTNGLGISNGTLTNYYFSWGNFSSNIAEHKYLFSLYIINGLSTVKGGSFSLFNRSSGGVTINENKSIFIYTNTPEQSTKGRWIGIKSLTSGSVIENLQFYVMQIDLTLIYGAGLEPSTPEQFEADYKKWFGKDLTYEPYDAGSLRSVTMEGFKSVGFNLLNLGGRTVEFAQSRNPSDSMDFLDENVVIKGLAGNGYIKKINIADYSIVGDSIMVRTSNTLSSSSYGIGFPIKVLPGARYYFKHNSSSVGRIVVSYVNKDGYIFQNNTLNIGLFTPPSDAVYMIILFLVWKVNATVTFINPIVNLDSSLNGTYITGINPSDVSYDVTAMQGRLNGEGELVTPFADGLKSAGTVHDEIVNDNGVLKGIKRIGSVDLGTKQFNKGSFGTYSFHIWSSGLSNIKKSSGSIPCQLLCTKYPRSNFNLNNTYNIGQGYNTKALVIWDSSYANADATTFQAAMSGVMLYYELETPEEYVMEADALEYRCTRGGSEEVVGSVVSPTLEIEYEH